MVFEDGLIFIFGLLVIGALEVVLAFLYINPLKSPKIGIYASIAAIYFLATYLIQASRYRKVVLALACAEVSVENPAKLKMPAPATMRLRRGEIAHCSRCGESCLLTDLRGLCCPACGGPVAQRESE